MLVAGFASVPTASAATNSIVINEVVTNRDPVGDWVELANTTDEPIDISGWTAIDNGKKSKPITFPRGTVIPANGYYAFYTETNTPDGSAGFGLGGQDEMTISDKNGAVVDYQKWSSHGMRNGEHTSRGLVPDMHGTWQITDGATREHANAGSNYDKVFINEATTDGIDFIELVNNGDTDVNIGGWTIVDSGDGKGNPHITFLPNTIIPAGGYYVLTPDGKEGGVVPDGTDGFGLSAKDSLTLKTAAGEDVDAVSWTEKPLCEGTATSWSRYSEADNDIRISSAKTKDGENADPCVADSGASEEPDTPSSTSEQPATPGKIVINEVQTKGGFIADWVELYNAGGTAVDISGWVFKDDKDKHAIVFPKGTVIEPGGFYAFHTEVDTPDGSEGFGLGEVDEARLFKPGGNDLVDSVNWKSHTRFTWGRTPDGEGDLKPLSDATFQETNAGEFILPEGEPWPYEIDSIQTVDGFTGENFSGVDFDDNGNAWVVNNNPGRLFQLEYNEARNTYRKVNEWNLTYENGAGNPDAEGVSVGKDGKIYIATERDGDGPSRPSVLEFDPAKGKVTGEWNLKDIVGEVPPNFGLEAIAYMPDLDVYAVGVEHTGFVHFVRLAPGGAAEEVGRYENPDLRSVMALDYNSDNNELRVLCDEVCNGLSINVTFDGETAREVSGIQDRPALMENFANEGYGQYEKIGECTVDGQRTIVTRFLWSDDAPANAKNGPALRYAESTRTEDCTPETTPAPTVSEGVTTTSAAPTTVTVPAATETVTPTVTTTDNALTSTLTTEPTTVTETPTFTSIVTTTPTTTVSTATKTVTSTATIVSTTPTVTKTTAVTPTVTAEQKATTVETETAQATTTTPTVTDKVTTTPTVTAEQKATTVETETAQATTTTPTVTDKVTTTPTVTAEQKATTVETETAQATTTTPTVTDKVTTTPTVTAEQKATTVETETAQATTTTPTVTDKVTTTPTVTAEQKATTVETETAQATTTTPTVTDKVTTTPTVTAEQKATTVETETAQATTTTPTVTSKVTTTPKKTATPITVYSTTTAPEVTETATVVETVTETPTAEAAAITITETVTGTPITTTPTVTTKTTVIETETAEATTTVESETTKQTVTPTVTKKTTVTPTETADAATTVETETAEAVTVTPTVTKKTTVTPTETADAATTVETETAKAVTVTPTVTKKTTVTPTETADATTTVETETAKAVTVTPTVTNTEITTPTDTADAVTETVTNTAETTTVTAAPVTTTVPGHTQTATVTPTETVTAVADAADDEAETREVATITTTRTAPALTNLVAGETEVYYRVAAAEGAVVEVKDLPEGLTFDEKTGLISGKVAQAGTHTARIVTTKKNVTTVEKVRFEVAAAPTATSDSEQGERPLTTVAQPDTASVPAEAGSSLSPKCVATLAGWGIPLLALIPIGLASQLNIPGLENLQAVGQKVSDEFNASVQRSLSSPALAQFNAMLADNGQSIGVAAGALGAIALGVAALSTIAPACTGAEGSSSNGGNE